MNNKKQATTTFILTVLCLTLVILTSNIQNAKARETLTVQIQPPPKSTTMTIYDTITLTAQASGGPGGYNYQWYLNDTAINNQTSQTYTHNATQVGQVNIKCTATDATGTIPDKATSQTITLTIQPKTQSPPPMVGGTQPTGTPSTDNADTNQTTLTQTIIMVAVIIAIVAVATAIVMKRQKSKQK